jgi:hypothetical protein
VNLPGYDAWKTREPDEDYELCPDCGGPLRRARGTQCWFCERCDDVDIRLEDERERREQQ